MYLSHVIWLGAHLARVTSEFFKFKLSGRLSAAVNNTAATSC